LDESYGLFLLKYYTEIQSFPRNWAEETNNHKKDNGNQEGATVWEN